MDHEDMDGDGPGPPGEEGLPPVPGGWKAVYVAPNRLRAIRVQGLLEELGFTTYILEEALGQAAPLSNCRAIPIVGKGLTDSHLVAPAREAEAVERTLEKLGSGMEGFGKERGEEE